MEEWVRDMWRDRLRATGRAQARYAWVLLVAGIFFFALNASLFGKSSAPQTLVVPFFELKVDASPVWAAAPGVLFFLVLVFIGSLRTYTTSKHAILDGQFEDERTEFIDAHPNALDFAVYTTEDAPNALKRILYFSYPVFLSLLFLEGAWLLWRLVTVSTTVPGRTVFAIAGVATGVPALGMLGIFWARRIMNIVGTETSENEDKEG